MQGKTKAGLTGLFIVLGAGAIWFSQHGKTAGSADKAGKSAKDRPVVVSTTVVKAADFPVVLSLSGTVTPVNQIDIRPQISSIIAKVHVKEGSMVKAGDLLFTLDDRAENANYQKLAAQVAKDQALLADAKRNLNRQKELASQKFVSQSAVDTSQSNVDSALASVNADKAALAQSAVNQSYYRITAPASGRIGQINLHPGSLIQPGSTSPLTTLTQLDPITIAFNVPETRLNELIAADQQARQTGKALQVTASVASQPLKGQLSFIDSNVDSTAGSLKAKATFANASNTLWPGAQVNVSLVLQTLRKTPTVPVEAVQTGPDGTFVYLVTKDKKAKPQPVRIVQIKDGMAALSGIQPGITIVKDGGSNLRPGSTIREAGKAKTDKAGEAAASRGAAA